MKFTILKNCQFFNSFYSALAFRMMVMAVIILFETSKLIGTDNNQKFIRYSTRDGLSSNAQSAITQDKDGFMWIGTNDGLNRFDGFAFRVYRNNPRDSNSLKVNSIICLFTDSRGILWIGTYLGGLSSYNKQEDNFTNYLKITENNNTVGDNVITSITEDKYRRLWIGTFNGLCLYDPTQKRFYTYRTKVDMNLQSQMLVDNQIRALAIDDSILWIGYSSGFLTSLNINNFKVSHFQIFKTESKAEADCFINSICILNNTLWISTWGKGVWVFDKKNRKSYRRQNLEYSFVNCIAKDIKNQIWISSESNGLIMVDTRTFQKTEFKNDIYNKYSLTSNRVSCFYIDAQNNIWTGSKKGDLHYLVVNNVFQSRRKNPLNKFELSDNNVTCIYEDNDEKLWIGYLDGGIDVFDSKTGLRIKSFEHSEKSSLGNSSIVSIFQSSNGIIWIGTYINGLKKYDKKTNRFITYKFDSVNEHSIAANDIRHMTEDRYGNLWIATHGGGLNKLNLKTGVITRYKTDYANITKTINNDWLLTVTCDKHDNIWVGTAMGFSVIVKNNPVILHFTNQQSDPSSLSNNNVNVIFIDSKDRAWIGTDDGLNLFDIKSGTSKVYNINSGLSNSIVLGIQEDSKQNLWISTNKGLSKFNPDSDLFRNYFVDDGLETDQFNSKSCFKNKNGVIYFGGMDGIIYFNPDSIRVNSFVTPVYVTNVKLYNTQLSVTDKKIKSLTSTNHALFNEKVIKLKYNENFISFEFVALNYVNLQKNMYSFKLEGFEEEWSQPGTKREATYTNLNPGTYYFKVKASNNDMIWNQTGATVEIIISPPLWKTNWAYVFYFILFLTLLYIFRLLILYDSKIKRKLELEKLEVEKLQEMDMQKMQFFANVSHEFRTPLTLIIGPLEKLIKTVDDLKIKSQLKLIYRNTNRLLRLINQLMDFRKIEENGLKIQLTEGDIVSFIKNLSRVFKYEAEQRKIKFSIKAGEDHIITMFDSDKIDKVTNNLLSNAFKCTADNGSITIHISLHTHETSMQKKIKISVEDNGIGIPEEALPKIFDRFYQAENAKSSGTGIGLALTKDLVQMHGGEIKVESELGKGSIFTIELPYIETSGTPLAKENEDKQSLFWQESKQEFDAAQDINEANNNLPILLIIEDNADMRHYIKDEFVGNYRILETSEGKSGLKLAFDEIPDIIISDIMMPEIDGVELCKRIKTDEKTSHIPIILLTAKSSEEHTIEGLESGADDYVAKPFSISVLKARVKNLIHSRQILREKFISTPTATITEISPTPVDEKFLKKAIAIVEEYMADEEFDGTQFSSEIGMSRAQLYRKINAVSGQSVNEFIRTIRLKKAAEYLISSDKNVSEIVTLVGFRSFAYFTKTFKEYFGIIPTKYKEQYRK